jgi:hypothetical protein
MMSTPLPIQNSFSGPIDQPRPLQIASLHLITVVSGATEAFSNNGKRLVFPCKESSIAVSLLQVRLGRSHSSRGLRRVSRLVSAVPSSIHLVRSLFLHFPCFISWLHPWNATKPPCNASPAITFPGVLGTWAFDFGCPLARFS